MGTWSRSWALARTSFGIIGADKEMLWFPVLAGLFSILFAVAMIVPTFVIELFPDQLAEPMRVLALFATYFGLAFVTTFFNTCAVYTTKIRLSGGDATFLESVGFALGRVHLILAWSLVSASVGLFLRFLDELAERAGLIGRLLLFILRSVLASAWSLMTIFVVPSMVYRGTGPMDAIKDSAATLRATWGESLVRYYGMNLVGFVLALPFIVLLFVGASSGVPIVNGVLVVGSLLGILTIAVLFSLASTVFNTALYHYATTGVPQGYDPDVLRGAFRARV